MSLYVGVYPCYICRWRHGPPHSKCMQMSLGSMLPAFILQVYSMRALVLMLSCVWNNYRCLKKRELDNHSQEVMLNYLSEYL